MPYDGSGNYSLPAGSTATAGTTILASEHNIPLADIATALSNAVKRNGAGAMTGLLTLSGNASAALNPVTYQQFTAERAAAAITGGTIDGAVIGGSVPPAISVKTLTLAADISPTALAADANNYTPTDGDISTVIRLSSSAAVSITGLVAGAADGVVKVLHNVGSYVITLVSQSASSTAANRFSFATPARLLPGASLAIIYDGTSSRWRKLTSEVPAVVTDGGGRLTNASGFPVLVNSSAGSTMIYYSPYRHQAIPIYDGLAMHMEDFGGELSNDTTQSSTGKAGPAAVTTSSNYDLFVWNDAGTYRLTRGPAWSSGTSRGTGAGTTELVQVSGVYLNANAITNGPAAQRGTYVGTVRSNGSSQIDWIKGGAAAGGTAGVCGIWNMWNRVRSTFLSSDTGNSWTYATATWRSANASTGMRTSYIMGLLADVPKADYRSNVSVSTTIDAAVGIGYDSTSALLDGATTGRKTSNVAVDRCDISAVGGPVPEIGFHFLQALEYASAATATFYGDDGTTYVKTGLFVECTW